MNKVELLNMEFFAYHGCFDEEQLIGNKFIVSFSAVTDISRAALTDDINEALNYQTLYGVIKEEMEIKSRLLENVAYRILSRAKREFLQIELATISISKINPPVGGKVGESKVIMTL